MTTGKYDRELSRKYPGLFVILLDQSASMDQEDKDRHEKKANIVTAYVNKIIQRMITSAGRDEYTGKCKNYAYLSILGYNDNVYPLLKNTDEPVDLATLDEEPRGYVPIEFLVREKNRPDRYISRKEPFWVKPEARGNTQMYLAFQRAKVIVDKWLTSRPALISEDLGYQAQRNECFPPLIINITDAKHNGDGNPEEIAREIQQMHTDDGNVLIFNCHFTHEKSKSCLFPKDLTQIEQFCSTNLDRNLARQMFEMSSPIPDTLRNRASRLVEEPIERDARCFVYNASPDILLQFLVWSTLRATGIRN